MKYIILLLNVFQSTWQKGYYRTEDLPIAEWTSLKSFQNINSKVVCGGMCEANDKNGLVTCNAFKYKDSVCSLAYLTYLVELEEGVPREPFYMEDTDPKIQLRCRGGEGCCSASNLCEMYKGDCNGDDGCYGIGMVCGNIFRQNVSKCNVTIFSSI